MKVIYRERVMLGAYKCKDYTKMLYAEKRWKPDGTSLWYFQNGYQIKTVAEEDIISIEE